MEQGSIIGYSYSINTNINYSWTYLKPLTKFLTGTIVANSNWSMQTVVNFETDDKLNPTTYIGGYVRNNGGGGYAYLYITVTGY